MDPLSITASVLSITTAAIQATKSLCEAVQRFKDRNKTLRRLRDGLQDLLAILESLEQAAKTQSSILELLRGPIGRCSQECYEFKTSLEVFDQRSEAGFRDWARMEFKRGDINEFIENIAGYKATISIALGTITMHASQVTQQVLQEYNEMIKDTMSELELRLRHIDANMKHLPTDNMTHEGLSIDLRDERKVTKQCLRICVEAADYLKSLARRESILLEPGNQDAMGDNGRTFFDAQFLTRRIVNENRGKFGEVINQLQKRLESKEVNKDHRHDRNDPQSQVDAEVTLQCLEVCKKASEITTSKIFRVGEATAKGDSDQMVVSTLADLFDVSKALSQDKAKQLVASMASEDLRHLAELRYGNRLRTSSSCSNTGETTVSGISFVPEGQKDIDTSTPWNDEKPKAKSDRPSSNETRKRATSDVME